MDNMIGKDAPEWSARAYIGGESVNISSEDMKGKWYLMYWYPFDFTFICPTEIVGFEQLKEDFEDDGITVIGCLQIHGTRTMHGLLMKESSRWRKPPRNR